MDISENIQKVEAKEEDPGKKTYPRVDQHQKKFKKKDGKKCWYCHSPWHLKKYCPKIRCFYCRKRGHVKAVCNKKKVDYIFNKLMESYEIKNKKMKRKEKRNKQKREKNKQWKIVHHRAQHMTIGLKKTGKGDVQILQWKGQEVGEIIGRFQTEETIKKFQQHQYNKSWILALVNKETPLRNLTLYQGLTNWCGCGEIDLGSEMFAYHVRRFHNGIIPIHSQLNRPFWFDCVKYNPPDLEEKFCFSMDELGK